MGVQNITLIVVFTMFYCAVVLAAPKYKKGIKMPETCAAQTYCQTKHLDYPEKIISRLFHNYSVQVIEEEDTEHRQGPNEEFKICAEKKTLGPIYEILDKEGRVRFVAQVEDRLKVDTEVKICEKPGNIEAGDVDGLPLLGADNGVFYMTCEEYKLNRKFLVLSLDQKSLEIVEAKDGIPVGCACRLRFIN